MRERASISNKYPNSEREHHCYQTAHHKIQCVKEQSAQVRESIRDPNPTFFIN